MRQLRLRGVSISAIFEFPNPIDASIFKGSLDDKEWFKGRRRRRPPERTHDNALIIGDVKQNDNSVYEIGVTEGARILYSNNTSLPDFGNCAFLTLASRRSYQIDHIIREAQRVFELLSEVQMSDQLATFEMHIDANARVNDEQDIDLFFDSNILKRFEEIHGEVPSGQKITLKSRADPKSNNWYRISIDLTENMNPLLWGLDYQKRFDNIESFAEEDLEKEIEATLQETIGTTNGENG